MTYIETTIYNMVILSETMPLGGTSTFAINVSLGMKELGRWNAIAGVIRDTNEVSSQMRSLGLPVISPADECVLHEDRVEDLYRQFVSFSPKVVVAALSSGSFDFLRFVPEGTVRIGMIQSDEEGFYELVERYLPWLDAVAGVSSEICRKMEARLKGCSIPVFHQPYGVPMPAVAPTRTWEGPLKVLYIGRVIEEQKRVSMMSRVIRATLDSNLYLEWTIAGDGPELPFLLESFKDDDRVRFLGQVAYTEIQSVLAEQDVYFLCSDYEGLPLSLLEAMGSGLVPVVSDLQSGISEVVRDCNGIRVPMHDELGYFRALARLASDRSQVAGLSAEARKEVLQSHSTLAMANRWESMIESLIQSEDGPDWTRSCVATAPLDVQHQWWFHSYLRPLRAMIKRLRSSLNPSIAK